jgi:putrescine transport system permease protein
MIAWLRRWMPGARWLVIAPPYVWLLLFFAVPFAIALKISFAKLQIASPPYTSLIDWNSNELGIHLNFDNYFYLFRDSMYANAYWSSLEIAVTSTLLCLLIGYPIAYAIAKLPTSARNAAIMLVVLPSWTSFLIRIYAWIGILKNNGLLNNFLIWLGLIHDPLQILHTKTAIYIGIVYAYLPFMVLPLYTNLVKHDPKLLEAAYDLGAKPWKAFLKVTLPLSQAGIVAGSMLVLIPAVGEFVIPELLGPSTNLMIGRVLWQEYFDNRDWPVASAVSLAVLFLLLIPIMIFHHYQSKELESRLS